MKPMFAVPKGALDLKPPYGAPCNRCGLCCITTTCDLGQAVFNKGAVGACPGVTGTIGNAGCGVAADPMKYRPMQTAAHGVETMRKMALLLIGAGDGCDARFNGEPRDPVVWARWERQMKVLRRKIDAAQRLWGVELHWN